MRFANPESSGLRDLGMSQKANPEIVSQRDLGIGVTPSPRESRESRDLQGHVFPTYFAFPLVSSPNHARANRTQTG